MTTKEKLEKALEALNHIASGDWAYSNFRSSMEYTKDVLEEMDKPRMETVEVKMWKCRDCGHAWDYMPRICPYTSEDYCCNGRNFIELTGTYQRPVPEPKTWKGEVIVDRYERPCILNIPKEWIGKRIIVEVCE